jgi:uncharacterized protein (DUF362 family)
MKKTSKATLYGAIIGFAALCWFLVRVIPKPSRAAYPCQRAAFPIASSFILWLAGLSSSVLFSVRIKKLIREKRIFLSAVFGVLMIFSILIYTILVPSLTASPENYRPSGTVHKVTWKGSANRGVPILSADDKVAVLRSVQPYASLITYSEIESLVREAVTLSGGFDGIVHDGDTVILKPNLVLLPLSQLPQYQLVSGMCTDWRVVRAVAVLVRELDPHGKIYVLESSSATSTREVLNFYGYTLANIPEADQIIALEDSCGAYKDFNDPRLQKVYLNDNIRLYPDSMKPNHSAEFYMHKLYYHANVVISIPVLKNHKVAVITGGIKNVAIGMAPPDIYGNSATFFGKWNEIDHVGDNLMKWIHDFYLCKPVDFVVTDGLQGMEYGPGEDYGMTLDQMQKNKRLILAGKNALSVDAIAGLIMELDPTKTNYMVYLDNDQLNKGSIDSRYIRVEGLFVDEVKEHFAHNQEIVINAMISDSIPPDFTIDSLYFHPDTLLLSLAADTGLKKAEVAVNGIRLPYIIIDDFTDIRIPLKTSLANNDTITVYGYDQYLNKTVKSAIYTAQGIIALENVNPLLLDQNYPNPFRSATAFRFYLPEKCRGSLDVYDVNGKTLTNVLAGILPRGQHQASWETNLPAGIYYYSLTIHGKRITRKMVKY